MFIKRTTEELKEGMKINLAGRIGKIIGLCDKLIQIEWDDDIGSAFLNPSRFPDLLIEKPEPKISKEAAEAIKKYCDRDKAADSWGVNVISIKGLSQFLDSMTE